MSQPLLAPPPRYKTLVFFPTYNEAGNVKKLLAGIWASSPTADVLVIDDNSTDGTGQLLKELTIDEPRLNVIHRPRKLGLGSAHFMAMFYAIENNYDCLVTMDADLSHDPSDIPRLLSALDDSDFVTGSRYMPEGSCDYSGYRKQLSVVANFSARLLTGVKVHEFTTSFRGFKVKPLSKVKFNWVGNYGYSFFLESIVRLHSAGLTIQEIPIHFYNRHSGSSKIPTFEIFRGAFKLSALTISKYLGSNKTQPSQYIPETCANCGGKYLYEVYSEDVKEDKESLDSNVYKCSSMSHASKPRVGKCLQCGLVQVPQDGHPADLDKLYEDVVDSEYVTNLHVKEKTFAFAFEQIRPFLPPKGSLLEIGSYCGLFLKQTKKAGWQCTGIEPSQWASQYSLKSDPHLRIINAPFEVAKSSLSNPFDVIVSWDVIEHVSEPSTFIHDAAGLLKPGGIFAFSTMDIDSRFAKLLGKYWPWIMQMHLYYFTTPVLKDMLARQGLELIHTDSYRHYASLKYMYKKFIYSLPSSWHKTLFKLGFAIPEIILPVTLGDIKLFIARKI
jgi:glycosyltransferase involved in cell wall biosynthesis/2-polyprenyl-3-methyl-5-hydroxy-6-metoxy-1,4-benzoquinol methylase